MLLLGVRAHTDTHQLLLFRSVTLVPPYASPCLLPSGTTSIKKGRFHELLQRR